MSSLIRSAATALITLMVVLPAHAQPPPPPGGEAPYPHDTAVTTVGRREQTVFTSPDAITVIDAETIARKTARTLMEALEDEPSLGIRSILDGDGYPIIRGMSGGDILILVDGVPMYDPSLRRDAYQFLNGIDPGMIERIEVVRGPQSVFYGSDAFGGVINIITRKPDAEVSRVASTYTYRYAPEDGNALHRLDTGFRTGGFSVSAGAGLMRIGGVPSGESADPLLPGLDGYYRGSWNAAVRHGLFGGTLALSAWGTRATDGYDAKARLPEVPPAEGYSLQSPVRDSSGILSWDLDAPSAWFGALRATVSWRRRDADVVGTVPDGQEYLRHRERAETRGFGVSAVSPEAEKYRLTYGIEGYRSGAISGGLPDAGADGHTNAGAVPDGSERTIWGVFAEYTALVSERVAWIQGIRWSQYRIESDGPVPGERFDDGDSDISWSEALSWTFGDSTRATVKVSRGFRVPGFGDTVLLRYDAEGTPDAFSPSLKPESVTDYELVLKGRTGMFVEQFSLYYMDYDGLIERVDGRSMNRGDAVIWGIEHSAYGSSGSYRIRESVTMARGADRPSGTPLSLIPPLMATVSFGWDISSKTDAELVVRYARKQDRLSPEDRLNPFIPESGTPGYTVFDLRYRFRINDRAVLDLVGENLSDRSYIIHGSGIPGTRRGLRIGLTVGDVL